ncbi:MAG: eukaryotic-like serine/threonine-protein kinase [Chthoniobacter sp.]|jgi:tRNA A-37 threonylcarbamoyl transferase component Bud32|nr:eukaryotic-like serine/threonine-protein kinase [Chthoniobacter sp.]
MNPDPIFCDSCGAALDSGAPGGLCPRCLMAGAMQPTEPSIEGGRQPPPSLEAVQAAFPQLEILGLVGQGGMGWVFKARQTKLNRLVALKLLPSSLAERDPAFAERFAREGQLLARLHHPNIVAVHDSGTAGEFFYLLMEFVEGVNLRQAMRSNRFTPAQALAIVPHICDALQFAHDEGVLHRDIKPENILLDGKGGVKLADFGIAKLMVSGADFEAGESAVAASDLHLTQSGTALGTPSYMAPEQRDTPGDVDHRADIYSLGVVFYELLTGELPLGKFAPPSEKSASDPRLDGIVQQALEKERERRQQSVGEMRTQVETIAGTPGGAIPAASPNQSPAAQPLNEPRCSRLAIVGAYWAWAPIFLIALGTMFNRQAEAGHDPGLTWWEMALVAPLLPLGFSAPVGTTILGWVAIAQIRRSAGKLSGLGLAVADGLFFPLLILDGVFAWLGVALARLFVELCSNPSLLNDPHIHPTLATRMANLLLQHPQLALLVAVVAAIVVDFFIVRAVWRAVAFAHSSPSAPAAPRATVGSPLAYAAMFFAVLSGILGSLAWFGMPEPSRVLVSAILASALLGILLAVLTRTNRLGKHALVIGAISLAIWLIVAAVSSFHYRSPTTAGGRETDQSRFPQGAYIGGNPHAVMVVRDEVELHYVFYHAGGFSSSSSGSHNTHSLAWMDEGAITLNNGRTFGYHRESVLPDFLHINGKEYDLRQGRVFVLHDDGELEKLSLFPSLADASAPDVLARLIAASAPSLNSVARLPKLQLEKSVTALQKLKAKVVQQEAALKAGTIEAHELRAAKNKAEALDAELEQFKAAWYKFELALTRHETTGGTYDQFAKAQNEVGTAEVRLRAVQAAAEDGTDGKSFGPIMERLVPASNEGPCNWFDVERARANGKAIVGRKGDDHDSADFAAVTVPGRRGLITGSETGFGSIPLEAAQWDTITPGQLAEQLKSATVDTLSGEEPLPKSYGFTTRAGGMGILQITGLSDNPSGLKIRYKLLQNVGSLPASSEER